jgi:integrative and conjugative element protein (TIGR02256 family)
MTRSSESDVVHTRVTMSEREFWSQTWGFGLAIATKEIDLMIRKCKAAQRNETGGVLAGHYSDDHKCAHITSISGAPPDSKAGRSWFRRGIAGLQRWIDKQWGSKSYYLGEWHFHPFAAPDPSATDITEMKNISITKGYRCPEPILVILGGDPAGNWHLRAFVFPKGQDLIELVERQGKGQ